MSVHRISIRQRQQQIQRRNVPDSVQRRAAPKERRVSKDRPARQSMQLVELKSEYRGRHSDLPKYTSHLVTRRRQ